LWVDFDYCLSAGDCAVTLSWRLLGDGALAGLDESGYVLTGANQDIDDPHRRRVEVDASGVFVPLSSGDASISLFVWLDGYPPEVDYIDGTSAGQFAASLA
jgi:hypothetical protein